MKLSVYTILFFLTCCIAISCKTAETAKTTSTQNRQPTGYTIAIIILNSGNGIAQLMDRIHQSCNVTGVQIEMNNKFIDQDCEIHVSIMAIPDKQLIMARNALYLIPEVEMIMISKN